MRAPRRGSRAPGRPRLADDRAAASAEAPSRRPCRRRGRRRGRRSATGPAGRSSSQPTSRPGPRTSCTAGQCGEARREPLAHRPHVRRAARRRARRGRRRPPRTSRGCRRRSRRGRRGRRRPPASSATSRQPIGRPFASPFASATRSGWTPSCSWAKNVPVRPTPHCTSSKKRSAPLARARARRPTRGSARVAGLMPPSPWIGSSRTQPTLPSAAAAASDSASFSRAKRTSGTSGPNPAHFAGWPVTESAPNVRPWNDPSSATIPGLPLALRAYLRPASIASAPELQKNAWAPPKRAREPLGELGHRAASSRGSRRATAGRAGRARPRRRRDGSARARRPRSRRGSRGSASRRRR